MNPAQQAHHDRMQAAEAAGYRVETPPVGGLHFIRPDASVQLFFMEVIGSPEEFVVMLDDWAYYRHLNAPAVAAAAEKVLQEYPQEDPEFVWKIVTQSARLLYRQRLRPSPWPVDLGFWNVRLKDPIPVDEWPKALRKRMGEDFYTIQGLREPLRLNKAGSVDY